MRRSSAAAAAAAAAEDAAGASSRGDREKHRVSDHADCACSAQYRSLVVGSTGSDSESSESRLCEDPMELRRILAGFAGREVERQSPAVTGSRILLLVGALLSEPAAVVRWRRSLHRDTVDRRNEGLLPMAARAAAVVVVTGGRCDERTALAHSTGEVDTAGHNASGRTVVWAAVSAARHMSARTTVDVRPPRGHTRPSGVE